MVTKRKKTLESCRIKSNNKILKVGDTVLLQSQSLDQPPYVAKIEDIQSNARSQVKLSVRWYYRPEETQEGRQPFHGAKELLFTDHLDTQRLDTVLDKCVVHNFENYTKLGNADDKDYYSRYTYYPAAFHLSDKYMPPMVDVYCVCEEPYNPDRFMVQCEGRCENWFHPKCIGLRIKKAKAMKKFICSNCIENDSGALETSANDFVPPKKKTGEDECLDDDPDYDNNGPKKGVDDNDDGEDDEDDNHDDDTNVGGSI